MAEGGGEGGAVRGRGTVGSHTTEKEKGGAWGLGAEEGVKEEGRGAVAEAQDAAGVGESGAAGVGSAELRSEEAMAGETKD